MDTIYRSFSLTIVHVYGTTWGVGRTTNSVPIYKFGVGRGHTLFIGVVTSYHDLFGPFKLGGRGLGLHHYIGVGGLVKFHTYTIGLFKLFFFKRSRTFVLFPFKQYQRKVTQIFVVGVVGFVFIIVTGCLNRFVRGSRLLYLPTWWCFLTPGVTRPALAVSRPSTVTTLWSPLVPVREVSVSVLSVFLSLVSVGS